VGIPDIFNFNNYSLPDIIFKVKMPAPFYYYRPMLLMVDDGKFRNSIRKVLRQAFHLPPPDQ